MIYLDSAAAEKPVAASLDALNEATVRSWGNPNSAHAAGRAAAAQIRCAQKIVAECLNCKPSEVHFCGTACEAAQWVAESIPCTRWRVSGVEHDCVNRAAERGSGTGYAVIAQMLSNNETGEIYPAPMMHTKNCLWICDATAAVGHIRVDFQWLGCDYLIADALKFGGVPGAAILIAREGVPLSERHGTPSVPLIASLAAALEDAHKKLLAGGETETFRLLQELHQRLSEIPGYRINRGKEECQILPHILNCSFEGVDGDALAAVLSERYRIMVSTGAACRSGTGEPSRVLLASGVPEAQARGAIRISLCRDTTAAEIETAAAAIAKAVEWLRTM